MDSLQVSTTRPHCKNCHQELRGRTDKRFCDADCRSKYHYQHSKSMKHRDLFVVYESQLRRNYFILLTYAQVGKAALLAVVREGFQEAFFTAYSDGYYQCYDLTYCIVGDEVEFLY